MDKNLFIAAVFGVLTVVFLLIAISLGKRDHIKGALYIEDYEQNTKQYNTQGIYLTTRDKQDIMGRSSPFSLFFGILLFICFVVTLYNIGAWIFP